MILAVMIALGFSSLAQADFENEVCRIYQDDSFRGQVYEDEKGRHVQNEPEVKLKTARDFGSAPSTSEFLAPQGWRIQYNPLSKEKWNFVVRDQEGGARLTYRLEGAYCGRLIPKGASEQSLAGRRALSNEILQIAKINEDLSFVVPATQDLAGKIRRALEQKPAAETPRAMTGENPKVARKSRPEKIDPKKTVREVSPPTQPHGAAAAK